MAFVDVIDDYTTGATGTLTTAGGEAVNYTIVSGVATRSLGNTDQGAEIQLDGDPKLEISFDVPVSGLSLSFDRGNPGETYFIEINGVLVDLNVLLNAVPPLATFETFNAVNNGAGTHSVTSSGGVSSNGNFNNNSLGILTLYGEITSIGVLGGGGAGGGFDIVEVGIDSTQFDVLCFAAGTMIATPDGQRDVADIRANGKVLTAEGLTRQVKAITSRHLSPLALWRETRLRPVLIRAGALGQGLPHRDLRVSRQHRILVASRIARRLFGQTEVLVPAIHLTGLPGISIDMAATPVDYHHLVLERHEVLLANGCPAESAFGGDRARSALEDASPESLAALARVALAAPARPIIAGKEAKTLVAAHARHGRVLLEEWVFLHA